MDTRAPMMIVHGISPKARARCMLIIRGAWIHRAESVDHDLYQLFFAGWRWLQRLAHGWLLSGTLTAAPRLARFPVCGSVLGPGLGSGLGLVLGFGLGFAAPCLFPTGFRFAGFCFEVCCWHATEVVIHRVRIKVLHILDERQDIHGVSLRVEERDARRDYFEPCAELLRRYA